MRRTVVSCLVAALVLAACASVNPDGLKPGASLSEITQQMGDEQFDQQQQLYRFVFSTFYGTECPIPLIL